MGGRAFDVVVFGATGFTGKLVAEYLAARFGVDGSQGIKWTIAGRSAAKLAEVRASLTTDKLGEEQIKPIVADVGDAATMRAMCQQTRVVVTTVGPFAIYGEALVSACVAEGTDYADITGEALFVRKMIDRYDTEARAKGVRIVSMSGYDSVPSDIGSFLAVSEFHKNFPNEQVTTVKAIAGKSKGGVSGGTCASIFNIIENSSWAELKMMGNPYILCPAEIMEGERGPDKGQQSLPRWEPQLLTAKPQWSSFFVMSSVNAAVVRRSQYLQRHQEAELRKSPPYGYDEAMGCGAGAGGLFVACVLAALPVLGGLAMLIPPLRWCLKWLAPNPGEGPTASQRENGCFNHHIVARGGKNHDKALGVKMSCDFADPGYKGTALLLATAGVCLALDQQQTTEEGGELAKGGVLTPSTAMGMSYVKRLKAEGIKLMVMVEVP